MKKADVVRFLKDNGVCWHNVKNWPCYAVWVMGMWWKHWRKSEHGMWKYVPKMWDLFPISVSSFVYDKEWDELSIWWRLLSRFWTVFPLSCWEIYVSCREERKRGV